MIRGLVFAVGLILGCGAWAEAPLQAMRPTARPAGWSVPSVEAATELAVRPSKVPPSRVDGDALLLRADLGDGVAFGTVDMVTGARQMRGGAESYPPASVTKVFTALYALEHLPPQARFQTRLLASGPIEGGVLHGDLALVGGGDPSLDSDDLAQMVEALAQRGVTQIAGRFWVWGGALGYAEELAPEQMDHLSYNPSLGGLNLNFNRVHMRWQRSGGGYRFSFVAQADDHAPLVVGITAEAVARSRPVFSAAGPDHWQIAASALGDAGGRWMPVRQPDLYAGASLRALAAQRGIVLPGPQRAQDMPGGYPLAIHESASTRDLLADMLEYSNNLIAEAMGQLASLAATGEVQNAPESARLMREWIAQQYGVQVDLRDHSGLEDDNRVSVEALLTLLGRGDVYERLWPLLKPIQILDAPDYPGETHAKTGTLNFVSSLAGYVRSQGGGVAAFAILSADLDRRAAGIASGQEVPEGAFAWNDRAKWLQDALLRRWQLRSR